MAKRLKKPIRMILKTFIIIIVIFALKWLWVAVSTMGHGSFEEKKQKSFVEETFLQTSL